MRVTSTQTSANSPRLATVGANRLVRLLGEWADGEGSMHGRLASAVRHLVLTGAIGSGTRMPSERALATALGISRNTIGKAFDQLRGDGLFTSRQGDGTYVTAGRRHLAVGDDRLRSFVVGPERPSLQIDLRSAAMPGLPMVADSVNLLDGRRMRSLVAMHGYIPSGLVELREAVADYYSARGLETEPDQIAVTSGAQQALRLVASTLAEAGQTAVVEEPTFRGAIESLRSLGLRLVAVPSGPDGVDVDALAALMEHERPAMVVLQSTVHNPTGSVLDPFRRRRVAHLATRFDVPVIDDATLSDTVLDGDRRPLPLATGSERIITIGSVSKSFWGGLRVGWVRAPADLVERLAAAKGGEDLGTSLIAQLLAAQLLPDIEAARDERHAALWSARRSALDLLATELPDWTPQVPAGGASLWVRLPAAVAPAFVHRAARAGVQILPGPTFSIADGFEDHVRLSYANGVESTARGIEVLARVWEEFAAV